MKLGSVTLSVFRKKYYLSNTVLNEIYKSAYTKLTSGFVASRAYSLQLQELEVAMASPEKQQKQDPGLSKYVGEEELSRGKWLSLNEMTYTDPSGRKRKWELVKRTTKQAGSVDAVGIIAIIERLLKYDCIVLVRQYRPPMRACTIEFPAGLVDPSESAETCAVRELKEETGYTGVVKHSSPATAMDPGVGNTTLQLVTVEIDGDLECNKHPKQNTDETECIEVINVPINELLERINEMAASGSIVDSRVFTYAIALEQAKKIVHITNTAT